MKYLCITIARKEFKQLFHTPLAWILLCFFWVYCAYLFFNILGSELKGQILFKELPGLTFSLFGSYHGLYTGVVKVMFCYIPVLTMNMMTQEYQSGAIKLLQSSPIAWYKIILGKYLALLYYAFLMLGILCLYVLFVYLSVENADLSLMLCGLLGVTLLVGTYLAIGLFMSVVTNYPIVAVLGTFFVLTFLAFVGDLWQDSDWMREITYWFSLKGRAENFISGLLSSSDIVYFLLLTSLALGGAILYGYFQYDLPTWYKKFGILITVLVLFFSLGYFSSGKYNFFQRDVSDDRRNSLSLSGEEIVCSLSGPLEVMTYTNIFSKFYDLTPPSKRMNDIASFQKYRMLNPEFHMDYFYYEKELSPKDTPPIIVTGKDLSKAEKIARICNVTKLKPKEIVAWNENPDSLLCLQEEGRFFRTLKWNGKREILRVFNDRMLYPGETEIVTALKRLREGGIKICWVDGENGKGLWDKGMQGFANGFSNKVQRNALVNQGFDCVGGLDSAADVIVVAPEEHLSEAEKKWLKTQLSQGKNMLIACDKKAGDALTFLFDTLGICLGNPIEKTASFSEELRSRLCFTSCDACFFFPKACELLLTHKTEFSVCPLIKNNLALEFCRDDQRIIVVGNLDFMRNRYLNVTENNQYFSNQNLVLQLFYWLSAGKYPLKLVYEEGKTNYIALSLGELNVYNFIFQYLICGMLIFLAYWILRKR